MGWEQPPACAARRAGRPGPAPQAPYARGVNNNTLWRVGDDYVLRRYDTFDAARVAVEHRLLQVLTERALPFALPVPLPSPTGDLTIGPFHFCLAKWPIKHS